MKVNHEFLKLENNYLFSDVARKLRAFQAENPGRPLLKCSIGDVTRPLPRLIADELKAAAETPTDPTPEEPTSGGSGCPVCGAEEHEIEWIGILHQVFYALKYLFNNVLYPIYKAIK